MLPRLKERASNRPCRSSVPNRGPDQPPIADAVSSKTISSNRWLASGLRRDGPATNNICLRGDPVPTADALHSCANHQVPLPGPRGVVRMKNANSCIAAGSRPVAIPRSTLPSDFYNHINSSKESILIVIRTRCVPKNDGCRPSHRTPSQTPFSSRYMILNPVSEP